MQAYVALYQLAGQLKYFEFDAPEWAAAYGVWLERRPPGAILRVLAEREQFDWQITGIAQNEASVWVGYRT